ncbi:MAG: hypothetical protein NVS2B16_35130 [Chloroflexota bacterium]
MGVPVRTENAQFTDTDWEVFPEGLRSLLERVHRDYHPKKIYITENGAAFPDVRGHDGAVHDPERTHYLESYLAAAERACDTGVPVAGYFVWSLLDNYEWAHGYWKRFGITYIDYSTLERVPKSSFHWYRDFIARQRGAAQGREKGDAAPEVRVTEVPANAGQVINTRELT